MSQIHVWQIVVDCGLVATILFMGLRWIRSSGVSAMIPRTVELEASLRSLIGEADVAGRSLNDQLLRREQNLQKLLGELEGVEQRLTRAMVDSEERQTQLDSRSEKAKDVIAELSRGLGDIRRELSSQSNEPERERAERPQRPSLKPEVRREAPVPPARSPYADDDGEFVTEVPLPARQKPEPQVRATTASARNQNSGDAYPPGEKLKAMQDVYKTAEELLRAGRKPEQVSEQTKINVEQIRLLSQMIEIERDELNQSEESGSVGDNRLGVLSGIRRQVQTL